MLAATIAELGKLQPRCRLLLVLRRRIVPLFTVRTLQCDNFAHLFIIPSTRLLWLARSANQFRECIPISIGTGAFDLRVAGAPTAPGPQILRSRQ